MGALTKNCFKSLLVMIFENVMVKIGQIPDITPEEKKKYGDQLTYIYNHAKEVQELEENTKEIAGQIEGVHKAFLEYHKNVDHFGEQYTRLGTAMERLNKCIDNMENLNKSTETAWSKLTDVEKKLLESPRYSSLKQRESVDDLIATPSITPSK